MKTLNRFSKGMAVMCGLVAFASGSDSIAAIREQQALLTDVPGTADSTSIPDTYTSFSVLQKKYLKTVIITNLLYAGGLGLNWGVVHPQMQKAEGTMDQLKVMPLSLLSVGMMYASIPISAVAANRTKRNYSRYYKESPRNFTMPLMFAGVGCYVGAVGITYWQLIKDYQDNKEFDGSYGKYGKAAGVLMDAGMITWFGTNLYSLAYVIILGEKAKKREVQTSLTIVPFRYGNANGCMLTFMF